MADRILLDDPYYSSDSKTSISSWWLDAPSSVLNSTRPIVVIMTRLYHDDIAGTVLSSDLGYDYLKIPPE